MQPTSAKQLNTFDIIYIDKKTSYPEALSQQEEAVQKVLSGHKETLFMVEHPALYTAGSSAKAADYLGKNAIPVINSGRGGQYTYHGPGQRVAYPILDLRTRGRDLRNYITMLQTWLVNTLKTFDINAYSADDVGVWVKTPQGEAKIAAIGVRVRKWVTFHGIALNIHPDLSHFEGIIPCGIQNKGVTSMHALGCNATMEEVDKALIAAFYKQFA